MVIFPSDPPVLRVLQLSDLHLFGSAGQRLLGQDTRLTFSAVLSWAQQTHWPVDLLLFTGDLIQDENPESYSYLEQQLVNLSIPCYGLLGNHDLPELMEIGFTRSVLRMEDSLQIGGWQFIFLNSRIPGRVGGYLSSGELTKLRQALHAHSQLPTLVCLHHQPVSIGSQWLDAIGLGNPEAFFACIDEHPQVRGVLWGHIHQAFQRSRKGVALLGTPSTCIQFLPGSQQFTLDARTPGFRWLHLYPDGRLETGIERIPAYPDPLELHPRAGGY